MTHSRKALAFNHLYWGTSHPTYRTGLGPILSPVIVPVFWGSWTEGTGKANDPDVIRTYLDGFAGWVSGVGAPLGYEPVVRQYGVIGANTASEGYLFSGSGAIRNKDIVTNLHSWQQQGELIPNGTNTIFLVLVNGFSSYNFLDLAGVPCATCNYHALDAGTYYGVVTWDGCGSDGTQCQANASHELTEAMTDPNYPGAAGWLTHEKFNILGYPTYFSEGADQCQNLAGSTKPHPFDNQPLSFGVVQNFTDNTVDKCTTWTLSTSSHLGLARTSNSQLDVFFVNAAGQLVHAIDSPSPNYGWSSEVITGTSGNLVGAPTAVSPASGRIDVFVRGFGGHNGNALNHLSKVGNSAWSASLLQTGGFDSGIGPPSATSWGTNRIDVVTLDTDATILHFFSTDGDNFGSDNLGGFSIGAPVLISRGVNTLDLFSMSVTASLQENSWNSTVPSSPSAWSGFYGIGPSSTAASGGSPSWALGNTLPLTAAAYSPASGIDYKVDLFVPFPGGKGLRYLRFSNKQGSGWASLLQGVGAGSNTYGASASAVNPAGTEVVVVSESRQDSPAQYPFQSYVAMRYLAGSPNDTFSSIPGVFLSPPAVLYGSDGFPEVIGIGQDGCLYETWLDYQTGGPIVSGPYNTGVCGAQ